jgi:hypothetical protein
MNMVWVLLAGVVLTLAGFFGPEDEGALELCGLLLIGIAIWKGVFA